MRVTTQYTAAELVMGSRCGAIKATIQGSVITVAPVLICQISPLAAVAGFVQRFDHRDTMSMDERRV